MLSYLALAALTYTLISLYRRYRSLQRNIIIAQASGIPYIVLPFEAFPSKWWMILQRLLLPTLGKLLPSVKKTLWFKATHLDASWSHLREIQEKIGETYLLVSPYGFSASVSNGEAIAQIAGRRLDFLKPVANYKSIDMFGRNLISSEGSDFRRHKKIVAPVFSEKSNALVFEESARQTEGILNFWAQKRGNTQEQMKITDTAPDVSLLALHVICGAGFGVPQTWPGEDETVLGTKVVPGFNTEKLLNQHEMTFKDSLDMVTAGFLWFALLPTSIMKNSPLQVHKNIYGAYIELKQYFNELFDYKKKKIELGEKDVGTMDLLAPLINASELAADQSYIKSEEDEIQASGILSKDEIISNAFIFLFAGHETAANTMHFSFLLLAINRPSQLHLQEDIDRILGTRKPSEWTYTNDMRNMYNSMLGAVQNEQLRLVPAVINIHKISTPSAHTITIDGKPVTFPPSTYMHLNVVGTQRNPKYYPHSPSKLTNKSHDMDDFVPERWLLSSKEASKSNFEEGHGPDGLGTVSYEKEGLLFQPAKGTFVAFSEGARACPGRRFAQVEITAVLAVIFQSYTVELDVSMFASDEDVKHMNFEERKVVYEKARQRAESLIRGSKYLVTLKMRGDSIPVRFVKRGKELFAGC